ncbi:hypothetical protein J504_1902 [Acinetobacter baumannii 348935]|nr:hypothetical protein J504_1902 [Acinetobacter baumannii 348935]
MKLIEILLWKLPQLCPTIFIKKMAFSCQYEVKIKKFE